MVQIKERRSFPVDVCPENEYHLKEAAKNWTEKWESDCMDMLMDEGYDAVCSETGSGGWKGWTLQEGSSVTTLTVDLWLIYKAPRWET